MIIWNGWGVVVIGIGFVAVLAGSLVGNVLGLGRETMAIATLGFLVPAGVVTWFVGKRMNRSTERELVDQATGERVIVNNTHSLFFIRVEWWGLIMAVAGILAVVVLLISDPAARTYSVRDLRIGDCVDLPADEEEFDELQHRPCGDPHDAEVIAVPIHPAASGAPYVSDAVALAFAEQECVPAFAAYTGKALDAQSELDIGYLYPTASAWGLGDRGFSCYIIRIDEDEITGSLRAVVPSAAP